MSYNMHRHATLRRLGIEQLPRLHAEDECIKGRYPLRGAVPIRTMPVSISESLKSHTIPDADLLA